jgi:hypothetical protein
VRDRGRDQSSDRGKSESPAPLLGWEADERSLLTSTMISSSSSLLFLRSYVPILVETDDKIDFDSSASDDRICIRAGIDPDLDQWRNDYACTSLRFQLS